VIKLLLISVADWLIEFCFVNVYYLDYLEIVVVILSVVSLSEANMYAFMSNYYRMFHKFQPDDWKMPSLKFWQKAILFLHALFSIGK
jgi:hypothetical protein